MRETQEYWSGLPYPSLGGLPDPGIEPMHEEIRDEPRGWGHRPNAPIPRSAREKDPRPGPLFEGTPVGEGTTRRGTATPVHRPQRPAGSIERMLVLGGKQRGDARGRGERDGQRLRPRAGLCRPVDTCGTDLACSPARCCKKMRKYFDLNAARLSWWSSA